MQSGNRRCEMEMTIIKLCNPKIGSDLKALEMRIAALESGISAMPSKSHKNEILSQEAPISDKNVTSFNEIDEEIPLPEPDNTDSADSLIINENTPDITVTSDSPDTPIPNWDDILSILKTSCPLIAGVLQGSSAYIKDNYLLIDTQNSQFKTLINGVNPVYRDSIRNAARQILGSTYRLGPYRKTINKSTDPLAAFEQKLKSLENN